MKSGKLFISALTALSISAGLQAQENVDKALEGSDQKAILELLRKQTQAKPTAEAPVVAAPAVPAPVQAEAAPAIRTLDEQAGNDFSSEELQQIRARLAAELEAAKVKAQVEEPVAPAKKEGKGLLGKIFGGKKNKPAVAAAAPARPALQRPDVAATSMKDNRSALDNLLVASRQDVIKQAMAQASGQQGSVNIVGEEKDWREAGPNAWKYNGEWTSGTMSGQGKLEFADGWSYVGSWINGTMSGQGILTHPDGTKYEGQWVNGKMHGLGKLTYPDGWQFIGQWADGQIAGQGTLVHPGE